MSKWQEQRVVGFLPSYVTKRCFHETLEISCVKGRSREIPAVLEAESTDAFGLGSPKESEPRAGGSDQLPYGCRVLCLRSF